MPLPARLAFRQLPPAQLPRSEISERRPVESDPVQLVKSVVELWRRSTCGAATAEDDGDGVERGGPPRPAIGR
ncbi:hypothetical protein J8J40_35210, partial [Mycobacterium tuberculosis]|nr:hypothetical protein [Mycobacterium tuberculosis]